MKMMWVIAMLLGATNLMAAEPSKGKEKAAMCQGCHGAKGVSQSNSWPNLAGQTAAYIERQLKNFKSGDRQYAPMNGVASGLSDSDIENLAAFFAAQPAASSKSDPALAKQGKDKAMMCLGCHGANGEGRGQFPRLAGQKPAYLEKQLKAFKQGNRKGMPMNAIAKNLSEQDIKALSAYFASL